MRRAARLLAVAAVVALAPAPARGAEPQRTGRLLVTLKDPGRRARAAAPAVLARAAARRSGAQVPQLGLLTVRPARRGASLHRLAERLRRDPGVRSVEVETRAAPRLVPDDPALRDPETATGTAPGTVVEWWAQRTGLFEAWDATRGGDTLVAVVDSGIDGAHPELAPKVRDSVDADPTPGAGGPLTDETGHGTHVASLACAQAGNGIGLAGAGLDCGLLVAKTDFSDGSVAQAVVDATDRGARVMNLSFGTDGGRVPPQALVDALRYAVSRQVVLVAAAADQATEEQGDPANVLQPTGTGPDPEVNVGLSVTAATASDQRASFAGYGTQISLASYGTYERGTGPRGIFGAWPANETSFDRGQVGADFVPPCRCRTTYHGDSRYAYVQGTSMATAIVSGVAALVRDLNPDLAAADVVRLLKQTARRPQGQGWRPDLGWGIVDARAAVAAARELDRRPPTSALSAPRRTRSGSFLLRWSGRDSAPAGVRVAGIDHFEIWRSRNGGPARRIAITRSHRRRVRGARRGRYAFYTVAVDRAGNREHAPGRPDATVRVARP